MMQIIHVNVSQDASRPLEEGSVYDMTYTVKWIPTDVTFARRFDIYLDYPFFEHQVYCLETHLEACFLEIFWKFGLLDILGSVHLVLLF